MHNRNITHISFKIQRKYTIKGSGIDIRNTMYADSPFRVEFAYAVVRDTFRRVGGGTNAELQYKNLV